MPAVSRSWIGHAALAMAVLLAASDADASDRRGPRSMDKRTLTQRPVVRPLEVVCVAGCNLPPPQIVYSAAPGRPVGPPVASEARHGEVIAGVRCGPIGGCNAVGTLPPTEWQRGHSHALLIWLRR